MAKHTVYIDESGNTGANFLDETQPILVLLGVGIPHESMSDILLRLGEAKRKFGYSVDHPLHAKNIAQRTRERLCQKVLNMLMEYEFNLFVSVSEKKYVLATIIYDYFFDPVYNDHCDVTWTHPSHLKPERADFIYNCLSDDAWRVCGQAFRNGDKMQQAYELVLDDIKNKTCDIDLYPILQGAKAHIDELATAFASSSKADPSGRLPTGVRNSPNILGFCGLTNKIEQYYGKLGQEVTITFDHSRQFTVAFLDMFSRLRDAKNAKLKMKGTLPLQLGYNALKRFDADKSKKNSFLQLSDLVATSVMDCLLKAHKGVALSVDEACLLYLIVDHWGKFEETFCDFLVSTRFLRQVGDAIGSASDVTTR